jgi:hypothetical protein
VEPNLAVKFQNFCGEILVVESATHNVSKTLFCIKIDSLEPEISSNEIQKTREIE